MKPRNLLSLLVVPALCLSSCGQSFDMDDLNTNIVENGDISFKAEAYQTAFSKAESDVNVAERMFAINSFKTISSTHPKNMLLSPLSLEMAMAMLCNGAGGNTEAEILKSLGFEGFAMDDINAYNRKLINKLQDNTEDKVVRISNSIWADQIIPFYNTFFQTNRDFYNAAVANVDLNSPESIDLINSWCRYTTDGHIDNIVSEKQLGAAFILLNTIYFREDWSKRFPVDRTYDMSFKNADGTWSTVKGMKNDLDTKAFRQDGFTGFSLGYKSLRQYISVIMPDEGKTIEDGLDFLAHKIGSLPGDAGEDLLLGEKVRLHLTMPRFTIENDYDLNDFLKTLGVKEAFTIDADFSNMSPMSIRLSEVRQKTKMEVDEEGSKVAVVTSGKGDLCFDAGPGEKLEEMTIRVDRPFLFYISNVETGAILFVGKVAKL